MSKILNDSKSKARANDIDQLVSKRLKMKRMLRGISQQELGKAIGVSVQQIQKYEKAANRISSGKLYTIAKFLDVAINYFFEEVDNHDVMLCDAGNEKPTSGRHVDGLDIMASITEKELMGIIKAFSEVRDAKKRKKIIELIRTIY